MKENAVPGVALIDTPTFMAKLAVKSESYFHGVVAKHPRFPEGTKRGRKYRRWLLTEADAFVLLWAQEGAKAA